MNFIMCAGSHTRWGYHIPKQLAEVDGEKLLLRTLRLLKNDAVVVTGDTRIKQYLKRDRVLVPKQSNSIIQSILSTRELWGDVNTFYLGDVYFTAFCMDVVYSTDKDAIHFIGSTREIYAVRIINNSHSVGVLSYIADAMVNPKLWNLYYYLVYGVTNLAVHIEPEDSRIFSVITDETCDFDYYKDYTNFIRSRKLASQPG